MHAVDCCNASSAVFLIPTEITKEWLACCSFNTGSRYSSKTVFYEQNWIYLETGNMIITFTEWFPVSPWWLFKKGNTLQNNNIGISLFVVLYILYSIKFLLLIFLVSLALTRCLTFIIIDRCQCRIWNTLIRCCYSTVQYIQYVFRLLQWKIKYGMWCINFKSDS